METENHLEAMEAKYSQEPQEVSGLSRALMVESERFL